jgi:uncharacterized protein YkuJ
MKFDNNGNLNMKKFRELFEAKRLKERTRYYFDDIDLLEVPRKISIITDD